MKPAANAIPPKWAWHYQALMRLRANLLQARSEHDSAARVAHERGGADLLDVAEGEVELSTLRAELAHEQTELGEIEAALQRLQDGTYGICEVTGEPIAPARLRALPWARLSQEAAARREDAEGRTPRRNAAG